MAKKGTPSLSEQKYDIILAHVLDPVNSPLPGNLQVQFDRVLQAARLLDRHPEQSQIVAKLQAKYNIGRNTAYQDIRLARELFKMNHEFDYDFWQAWQIKDLLELIRECKLQGKHKEWVNAHKTLKLVLGEKPVAEEDPRRLEKNNIYLQLNNNGTIINISHETINKLNQKEIKELTAAVYQPINITEAEDIMNS
jgi:hypothetical protein